MEEQALLLRENLLSIRSVLVTNRKKINKLRYKQSIVEQENSRRKKVRMREKIMETPKNIGKSLKGVGDSAVKGAKKSGLGNALGLLAIIAIGSNIESIKKLYNDFIKGETFKNIAEGFQNVMDFFKNIFSGFQMATNLLGDSYDKFIEYKDIAIEEIDKIKDYLQTLKEGADKLAKQALELKKKFENLLGGTKNRQEVEGGQRNFGDDYKSQEDYFKSDEYKNSFKKEKPKVNQVEDSTFFDNLGLTNLNNFEFDKSSFDFGENVIPFDYKGLDIPEFDFSQYNADETNKEITIITKTNTVIT